MNLIPSISLITLTEAVEDHSSKQSLETRKVKSIQAEHTNFQPPESVVVPLLAIPVGDAI